MRRAYFLCPIWDADDNMVLWVAGSQFRLTLHLEEVARSDTQVLYMNKGCNVDCSKDEILVCVMISGPLSRFMINSSRCLVSHKSNKEKFPDYIESHPEMYIRTAECDDCVLEFHFSVPEEV